MATTLTAAWFQVDRRGCWVWRGRLDRQTYGRWGKRLAHRVIFEQWRGAIPEGMTLDHLCRNPSCVNPVHLEAVPGRLNTLRGFNFSAVNARKSFCKNGHEFTAANTYRQGGVRRQCRTCNMEAARRLRVRRQAA